MTYGFCEKAKEELRYYVYVYIDPRNDEVFYIGKGKGNRAFDHLDDKSETEKVRRIEAIRKDNQQPKIQILTYGLENEETALIVEAAAIDLIDIENLTNQNRGFETKEYGKVDAYEFDSRYREKLYEDDVDENVMIIRINRLYRHDLTEEELYNATRGYWKVTKKDADKLDKVDYVFSVYKGRILEVYKVAKWFDAGTVYMPKRRGEDVEPDEEFLSQRKEFVGTIAEERIRRKYVNKSVEDFFPNGAANPVKYIWGRA